MYHLSGADRGNVAVSVKGRAVLLVVVPAISLLVATGASAATRDLDCSDFGSREAANRELDRTLSEFGRDIHRLDADGDGTACEWNGSAMIWTPVAGGGAVLLAFGATADRSKRDWTDAIGHAVVAVFVGLFAGWFLPGLLPRAWAVAAYALPFAVLAGFTEHELVKAKSR